MAIWKNLLGTAQDLFRLTFTGNGIKNHADGVEIRLGDDSASANLVVARPQGANEDVHAATYLDVKDRVFLIEWAFDGATPPVAGTNTGLYGFCHTSGGGYNAGEVYFDDGASLVLQDVYKMQCLTTSLAVTGTVSLLEDGLYQAETGAAPFTWTLKGDLVPSTIGLDQTILVPYSFSDMGSTVDSTTNIPAGARVKQATALVTTPFSGGAAPTLAISINGAAPINLQLTTDNDLTTAAQYDADDLVEVTAGNGGPVRCTLAGTATAGVGVAAITYVTPQA